jgi:hypothetical protein
MALLVACFSTGTALGITYDKTPRPTILLSDFMRFIAEDGWNSMALYRVGDALLMQRFKALSQIEMVAITSDDKFLLIACEDGSLSLWEVDTGHRVWQQSRSESGLSSVYDASFADNGESCVVCDVRDQALIFQTKTGKRLSAIRFPPVTNNIMSAALSPDGTTGVLITLDQHLYTFDVATGQLQDTGLTGGWPVRYSVDGKYAAFRSSNSGEKEHLRIVALGKKPVVRDIGQFAQIGHIRPAKDGSFLSSAQLRKWFDEENSEHTSVVVGVQVWPITGRVKELWNHPQRIGVNGHTDFLPDSMIGISTDYSLVTTLVDLRTGSLLGSIDNSANYRPIVVTFISGELDRWPRWVMWLCGIVILVALAQLASRRRWLRRDTHARS